MNYTTDPVADADSYTDALGRQQDAQEAAEIAMIDDFMKLALAGDMNALATFAPMVGKMVNGKWQKNNRFQTIAEVMYESLDYGTGPSAADLMGLLSTLASKPGADVVPAAQKLLRRMAETYASMNAEVDL